MTVTGTSAHPDRHASLSDGSTTIEFIFTDGEGKKNEKAFRAEPYPRTSLKTTQGDSKYSDLEPPYFAIAQDDFTGGRGSEDFESDTSRYYDGWKVDTSKESGVVLGGMEDYSNFSLHLKQMPGNVTWQGLYSTTTYIARQITASGNPTMRFWKVLVKKNGSPTGNLRLELWTEVGSEPGAKQGGGGILAYGVSLAGTVPKIEQYEVTQSLSDATNYWIVMYDDGTGGDTPDADNHWQVGCDSTVTGKKSSDGSSWSSLTNGLYYHVQPDLGDRKNIFFEYKSGLYMVYQLETTGNGSLYINGDRGVADSNSGDKTYLQDASKSGTWVADRWIGARVLITKGPGSEELQPWRKITDNDATSLTVSPDWEVAHTTSTEYVIIGSDYWTQLDSNLGFFITDVEVAGEHIWLATGGDDGDNGLMRIRYYNSSGTWTEEQEATASTQIADKLLAINHTDTGETLYCTTTAHETNGVSVYKGQVPRDAIVADQYLFYPIYEFNTSIPWADEDVSNVTQSITEGHTKIAIATGHTTGLAAVQNIDALNFQTGDALVAEVYSDVALSSATDYKWVIDDVENMGEENVPSKVLHWDDPDGTEAFTDKTRMYDGVHIDGDTITLTSDDYLAIGYSKPFNEITVDVGTTVNSNSATMTGYYFDGTGKYANVSASDGTASGGATLAKDGDITFSLPEDWQQSTINSTEAYWIILTPSANLTASVHIRDITVTRNNNLAINMGVVAAGTWTTTMSDISTLYSTYAPDMTSIKSIGLWVNTDKGENNFYIRKLWLAKRSVETATESAFRMPGNKRINGMHAYAGNVDDPILNPWLFTTDAVYEMQTQNSDQIVQIPLEELGALSSPENGRGHCVNGTYLYFNLGDKLERYFNRTLDDIGPDRDEGLPIVSTTNNTYPRAGIPGALASYPGRVYAGIDAGVDGISSILALDGTAWHEIYRAISDNERIRDIYIQSIPGTNVDRLWFGTNNDVGYVPISLNPYNETDYKFHFEGELITSWIYAGMKDVVKLWKSLKVFTENVSASNRYIVVDYEKDNDTTWTEIGTFDTQPVEEIDIASTLPQAKRIRFRFRFYTNDETESPRLKAYVVEGVAFVPVKHQYGWTFAVKQDTENIDLFGVFDDTLTSLQQYNQLVSWANAGDPLTLRHHSSLYDSKTVFLNPLSVSPLRVVDEGPEESQEIHIASITCIEA
jgi:hypothetical protein